MHCPLRRRSKKKAHRSPKWMKASLPFNTRPKITANNTGFKISRLGQFEMSIAGAPIHPALSKSTDNVPKPAEISYLAGPARPRIANDNFDRSGAFGKLDITDDVQVSNNTLLLRAPVRTQSKPETLCDTLASPSESAREWASGRRALLCGRRCSTREIHNSMNNLLLQLSLSDQQHMKTLHQSGSGKSSTSTRHCKKNWYTIFGEHMPMASKTLHHRDGLTLQERTQMYTLLIFKWTKTSSTNKESNETDGLHNPGPHIASIISSLALTTCSSPQSMEAKIAIAMHNQICNPSVPRNLWWADSCSDQVGPLRLPENSPFPCFLHCGVLFVTVVIVVTFTCCVGLSNSTVTFRLWFRRQPTSGVQFVGWDHCRSMFRYVAKFFTVRKKTQDFVRNGSTTTKTVSNNPFHEPSFPSSSGEYGLRLRSTALYVPTYSEKMLWESVMHPLWSVVIDR